MTKKDEKNKAGFATTCSLKEDRRTCGTIKRDVQLPWIQYAVYAGTSCVVASSGKYKQIRVQLYKHFLDGSSTFNVGLLQCYGHSATKPALAQGTAQMKFPK
jgi:hypothetical protein